VELMLRYSVIVIMAAKIGILRSGRSDLVR